MEHKTELPFYQNVEAQYVAKFKSSIQQLQLVGPELLLGKIFDEIGFNAITDDIFRHLVITRLVYPVSKLKTVLTKQHINNKGYNKYVKIEGQASISIDKEKYNDDKKWGGLKSYRTNTNQSKEEVIEQYHQLWQIEQAFRISKNDLQIRSVYHQLKRRIEAHICIAFAACKIYKELERQLKEKKTGQSPQLVIDLLKTILMVRFTTPYSTKIYEELIITRVCS